VADHCHVTNKQRINIYARIVAAKLLVFVTEGVGVRMDNTLDRSRMFG
jgi:hypothetical protein